MALPTITLNNQTGTDIVLVQLAVTVPASGSIVISQQTEGFDRPEELLNDEQLQDELDAGNLTVTISGGGLSAADTTKTVEQAKALIKPIHDLDIKHNLNGAVPPTVDDDESTGYSINSFWMDTVARDLFVCYDAADGAAVWKKLSPAGGTTFTYGAKFNTTGRYAAVNGPPGSASKAALNEGSQVAAAENASTTGFAWVSADADNTSVFTLFKNGVFEATLNLTGASGVLMDVAVSVMVGDLLAISYTSGTAPNDTNCQLILGG